MTHGDSGVLQEYVDYKYYDISMTRSPLFKIGLALFFLLIIFVSIFVFSRTKKSPNIVDTGRPNSSLPITDDNGTNPNPPQNNGADVPILNRPETVNLGSGSFIIAGGNDIYAQPPFQILFYEPDRSYTISLLAQPISTTRRDAETAFLELLSISKSDACALPVMVTTPYYVDRVMSGRDLGLSFCAGATPL